MLILRFIVITTFLLFASVTCEPLSAKNEFLMFFEFFSDRKRFSDTKIFNDRVKNDLSVIADEHDFKFKLVFYLTSAPNILKNDDSEIKDAFTTFHNKYKNIDDFGKIFDSISQKEENKNGVNLKGFAVTENKRFPGYTALLSFFQKDIAETKNLSNETQEKLKTYALNVAKERYQGLKFLTKLISIKSV